MDLENLKSWASQPDVCRCCLSTSGAWDITASYITEAGNKEVYLNMLQECFGITLSYLTDWGQSRLVCDMCVGHLRDACTFRKQVLQVEEHFVTYCTTKNDMNLVEIKTETDPTEREHSPATNSSHNDPVPRDDDSKKTVRQHIEPSNIIKQTSPKTERTNRVRKRHRTSSKLKRKRNEVDVDKGFDSDTPIAEYSKINTFKTNDKGVEKVDSTLSKENDLKMCVDRVEIASEGPQHTRFKNVVKQVSERKRAMLTCDTVLRDTTACPFRHHKSWFQCFFCTQDFMEINLLRHHTLQTHPDVGEELKKIKRYPRSLQIEISNLECRHCNLNLTDVDSMRRHFVEVHKKVIYNECIADYKVDASPYSCHLCDREFHVFRTLTTHLNEHYANCICDVCGKSFLNSKRLKVHKRTHENGQYPCNECGKILKTKTSKANHIESAHSKRVLKCQICFKPMKHYNDRIKHMSEEHNITHKFKCPICAREYNIKHYLATHIRQTHGHKNKKCLECGMAFITNHGLKKHMLKHTGVKAFTCTVCCKSYARSYTLREHMRAHDNERRFLESE